VLGRAVSDDPDYDIEIICGARRHAVARVLGRELLVEARPMSDAEAYVAMYEENLLREGDSPYVRGQILLRALRSGTYPSQEDLGRAFNLSHSSVSRLLMVAQLPSVVVGAFRSSTDIREGWGVELQRTWSDEAARPGMAARARALSGGRTVRTAREIYEVLMRPAARRRPRLYRNVPVRGASGAVLFHEQDQLSRVIFIIPKSKLSSDCREALRQMMLRTLEGDAQRVPPLE
jgi:ParB family chromosome partitioning protein